MKSRLKLKDGEELKRISSRTKGFMEETDIIEYHIVNSAGEVVGTVTHTDHTAVRGFKRTQTVEQKDLAGNTIVSDSW
ncbi:hypothetical protein [Pseudomonas sp. NCCP-436]|uniref:hypothetical protein n=1 Tax=Pseudomonas sp. NCCP-436 TaxID=2842481 RepID=UPI001C8152F3|nr:hypothetical protein [Pseudomonas sp. NCCP-436]GIZ10998.1 hypothetical protein NCCP436_04140 [Pseudomonas sp. NCCP-436]GIZ11004.1 hypothetical protein NCCP436_04200 [Pseudomonas sp. NCCP-436]